MINFINKEADRIKILKRGFAFSTAKQPGSATPVVATAGDRVKGKELCTFSKPKPINYFKY